MVNLVNHPSALNLRKTSVDPSLHFQHRDRQMRMQKAHKMMVRKTLDKDTRNNYLSKLIRNEDYVS